MTTAELQKRFDVLVDPLLAGTPGYESVRSPVGLREAIQSASVQKETVAQLLGASLQRSVTRQWESTGRPWEAFCREAGGKLHQVFGNVVRLRLLDGYPVDAGGLETLPDRLARAAQRSLWRFVMQLLRNRWWIGHSLIFSVSARQNLCRDRLTAGALEAAMRFLGPGGAVLLTGSANRDLDAVDLTVLSVLHGGYVAPMVYPYLPTDAPIWYLISTAPQKPLSLHIAAGSPEITQVLPREGHSEELELTYYIRLGLSGDVLLPARIYAGLPRSATAGSLLAEN